MATQMIRVMALTINGDEHIQEDVYIQYFEYPSIEEAAKNSDEILMSLFTAGFRWGGNFSDPNHYILWGPKYQISLYAF